MQTAIHFDGRTYRFPITDAKGGHYHHGILKSQPFAVSKAGKPRTSAWRMPLLFECGNDAIFRDFPHEFKSNRIPPHAAAGTGVMFANRSKEPMPVAWVPYADADSLRRVRQRLRDACAVGEQVELSDVTSRRRKLPLSRNLARCAARVAGTDCDPIEAAFTVREIEWTQPFRARWSKPAHGRPYLLRGGRQTTCWTIWNNGGKVPYCCPEPQSWTTNAPNMPDPEAEGFRSIAPRDVEHEIPVVREIVVVPESGTVSDEKGRRSRYEPCGARFSGIIGCRMPTWMNSEPIRFMGRDAGSLRSTDERRPPGIAAAPRCVLPIVLAGKVSESFFDDRLRQRLAQQLMRRGRPGCRRRSPRAGYSPVRHAPAG